MKRVRELLYGDVDLWNGFDPASVPDAKLETWWPGSRGALEALIREARPRLALEVGSWKGWSASVLAKAMLDATVVGQDLPELVCVDTWLGSAEMVARQDPGNLAFLHRKHGLPQIYWAFMANIARAGLTAVVTPYAQTSMAAAQVFDAMGLRFDFIYLDGAHDYESVVDDVRTWGCLLADGGVLAGDDYDRGTDIDVVEAVDDCVEITRGGLEVNGRTWRIREATMLHTTQ
jgi:predicted O-methyltransferase YrrM